jgi:hypothetical protein
MPPQHRGHLAVANLEARLQDHRHLFRRELLAVDGTRIKAVNNKDRNFTKNEELAGEVHQGGNRTGRLCLFFKSAPAYLDTTQRRFPALFQLCGDAVGSNPEGVAVRPDGKHIYVTSTAPSINPVAATHRTVAATKLGKKSAPLRLDRFLATVGACPHLRGIIFERPS